MKPIRFLALFCSLWVLILPVLADQINSAEELSPLTVKKIMRDRAWMGNWPRRAYWGEHSQKVYFRWNPENADNDSLYVIDINSNNPRKVSSEESDSQPNRYGDYDKNRNRKLFERDGDIFLYNLKDKSTKQITNTVRRESSPRFTHDGLKITYIDDGNLFIWNLNDGTIRQITNFREGSKSKKNVGAKSKHEKWLSEQQKDLFQSFQEKSKIDDEENQIRAKKDSNRPSKIFVGRKHQSNIKLSPNENFITFRITQSPPEYSSTIVPNYVTRSGFTEDINSRTKVGREGSTYEFGIYDRERDTVYFIETDSIPGIFDQPEYYADYPSLADSTNPPSKREVIIYGPIWSDEDNKAVVEILSSDNKDRWIVLLNLSDGGMKLLDRQHDEAWIGGPGIRGRYSRNIGWLPDNNTVWFQSEETGYSHLYTVDVISGQKKQLTSGSFEIRNLKMSRDKKYWYFVSNEIHPGEQQFYRMKISGGKRERITTLSGGFEVSMSPDEKTLAILHSTPNHPPELYLMENKPGAPMKKITSSLTDEFLSYSWRTPEIITFTARDSAVVYARLFKPDEVSPNTPAVMFVHGAGYLQNAHMRWSGYYREYMFHNLLADNGYIVLDVDYRGSAGYGRDWRTGIYRHMGGKDLDDYVDGARYLVSQHGVDSTRIGIYGGSYGGFLTLMALFKEPAVFKAGAALRSVTDWAHYNHEYTSDILNVPHLDSIAYTRSSPIYFAEGFQGALLMCHGMLDRNVHYQDIVRLCQRLIELGKDNWELASYPLDGHTFRKEENWTDEYSRIFKLFEENLKK
ncbi:MAG: prolyl oligopeptidase family serine peptidase [candidate division Zixibacteria bacterium]